MRKALYVRGFPSSFNKQQLKAKFRPFGNIKKVRVTSNGKKVFGIVDFYHEDHANIAIKELHGQIVDGITWYVTECQDRRDVSTFYIERRLKRESWGKTLYLRDFPAELTQEKLREIFEEHGTIESLCIEDRVAFITFFKNESAESAFEAKKLLKIDGKRVFVKILEDKYTIADYIIDKKRFKERKRNHGDDRERDDYSNYDYY